VHDLESLLTMRVWLDIDNPPQVQYLVPFKAALEEAGHDVVVTARDRGITLELMRQRGVEPIVAGDDSHASKALKALALVTRGWSLKTALSRRPRPQFLIAASRPAALAARYLGIPGFTFCDYEYVDLRIARLTRSYVVFPDVIDSAAFVTRGFPPSRLVPFPGLKESLSFASIDLDAVAPYEPSGGDSALARVLFRPPAEEAHYFARQSMDFAFQLLAHLARRSDVRIVFAPRYPRQAAYLDRFDWVNPPETLLEAVPFVALLKSVDAVISSGGTMLRESAYLGIPAYSILRSAIGAVDRYLETIGRVRILTSAEDFESLRFPRRRGLDPIHEHGADILRTLASEIVSRAHETGSRAGV